MWKEWKNLIIWKEKFTTTHFVKVAMVTKENATAKARIPMKTTTTKVALEVVAHAARVVAFV